MVGRRQVSNAMVVVGIPHSFGERVAHGGGDGGDKIHPDTRQPSFMSRGDQARELEREGQRLRARFRAS
jgi:hypothetical protein